jgi:hypothetical protein
MPGDLRRGVDQSIHGRPFKRESHVVFCLKNLEGIAQVHDSRNARDVAMGEWIQSLALRKVLPLFGSRLRLVRNLLPLDKLLNVRLNDVVPNLPDSLKVGLAIR